MASLNDVDAVLIGRVTFFCPKRGYGFIEDLKNKRVSFVHYTALQRASPGWRGLYHGEYVEFRRSLEFEGRTFANNVCGIAGGPLMCEHVVTLNNNVKENYDDEEVNPTLEEPPLSLSSEGRS